MDFTIGRAAFTISEMDFTIGRVVFTISEMAHTVGRGAASRGRALEVKSVSPKEDGIPPWVNIDFPIEDSGSRAETGSSEGHAVRNFRDEARNFHIFLIPNSKKSPATHGPGF